MSYVYLITSSKAVKIGIADSPKQRLASLQTSHHEPLRIYATFQCVDKTRAARLERLLHERYKANRLKGEWFDVNPEQVIADTLSDGVFKALITGHQIHEIWLRDANLASIAVREAEKIIQGKQPVYSDTPNNRIEEFMAAVGIAVMIVIVTLSTSWLGVSIPLHYVLMLTGFGFGLLFVFAIVLGGVFYSKLK